MSNLVKSYVLGGKWKKLINPDLTAPIRKFKGFTLIELLVVISTIAILSVIGTTIFTNTTKNAQDAKKKADVDEIAKALELKYDYSTATYTDLDPSGSEFAKGTIPKTPSGVDYYRDLSDDNKGFIVCAPLD